MRKVATMVMTARRPRRGTTASRPTRSRCRRAAGAPAWRRACGATSSRACRLRCSCVSYSLRGSGVGRFGDSAASSSTPRDSVRMFFGDRDDAVVVIGERANTTPMVSRPLAGTSATAERTTLPLARTTKTSSSSLDDESAREVAAILAQLGHLDAETAAALTAVLVDRGALGVAALGHDEHESVVPSATDADSRAVAPRGTTCPSRPRSSGPSAAAPRRSR